MKTPKFWSYCGWQAFLLAPVAYVYGAMTQWRIKKAKPYHSSAYVVCVGNITAGGVGKTPVALLMAEKYIKQGKKVFFLTRGYKSKLKNVLVDLDKHSPYETGDEARLLAEVAPTLIYPNRAEGAKVAETMGAEVIIMDDGFQNPYLYKDESWLVFDGNVGIGNGKIIPAGPLRESLADGEKRAQNILIMGDDKTGLAFKCHLPVHFGKLDAEPFNLANKNVSAFAGIGHPEKFYQSLKNLGYNVVLKKDFADHHFYTRQEIAALYREAEENNLALVTTAKDFVKLDAADRNKVQVLRVKAVIE